MSSRPIVVHQHPATPPSTRPPLLFVHGGYSHSLYWQQHFIPYFNQHGFDCYALDLSGHGASAGAAELDTLGLEDYADDLAEAVERIGARPCLIGHSMGTLVVQRYLARTTACAAGLALLAPVPPTGTLGSAARLALSEPEFFAELPNATSGRPSARTLQVMARVYFSPQMPLERVQDFMPMIGPESDRAVAEMATMPLPPALIRPRLPALVMGGGEDKVFPPSLLHFTAHAWRAETVRIAGAGHMLMLDPQWSEAAAALLRWMERQNF